MWATFVQIFLKESSQESINSSLQVLELYDLFFHASGQAWLISLVCFYISGKGYEIQSEILGKELLK